MGERSIIGVGVSLASEEVEHCGFDSNDSLLDLMGLLNNTLVPTRNGDRVRPR